MLDTIQQLLATLTTARTTPSSDLPTNRHAMYDLLTALVEESLVHAREASTAAWLDWQFASDTTFYCYEVDAQTAGTYQLVNQTNCASISAEVEERVVPLPFTVKAGEQLKLTIQRATPGIATVQLLRIGIYRQLVAC